MASFLESPRPRVEDAVYEVTLHIPMTGDQRLNYGTPGSWDWAKLVLPVSKSSRESRCRADDVKVYSFKVLHEGADNIEWMKALDEEESHADND